MRSNGKTLLTGWLLLAFLSMQTATTALSKTDKMNMTIPRIRHAPTLTNFLQMTPRGQVEQQMLKIEGFIQQEPKDGEPASQHTEVYLAHDDKNIYAVFVAFDTEPDKVRAHVNRRENVFNDDIVEIMIDTFQDEQRAFAFVANPLGVQWDALWTEGPGFDESFDTLWRSDGRLTDQGYVVSMTIPFKSLRFPSAAEQTWGVVFAREIRRGSFERSFWPRVSSRIEGRLNQAATLRIEESISPSRNIQLIPYGTYRTFRLLDQNHASGPRFASDGADPAGGLDAKWVFRDNMALDFTANPDFSQVESDRPQVTVNQRFEVFFPEKRPFFLENANFFNTLSNLVFTRRIADPQFGLRLTGKAGPYALGAILIDDQAPSRRVVEDDPLYGKRAAFGVLRVSRDILSQSRVGLIYTDREFKGSYNRVGGVDGRIKFNRNWTSSFLGVMSATKTLSGERFSDPAFNVSVNRNGRQLNSHFHYIDIHPNFNTETGFVPRTDTREFHTFHSYRFRPEGSFLISWGPNFFVQQIRDHDNLRLDQSIGPDLVLDFTGQTQLIVGYQKIHERLRPKDFAALTRNMDFERDLVVATFRTSFIDQLSFDSRLEFGTGINFLPATGEAPFLADRKTGDVELSLLPSSKFRVDNSYIFSELNERHSGARIFKNHILRTRLNWQHNRRFSLRLILQYNVTLANQALTSLQTTKNFNVDFLVTYLVNPWTALYVGMNSNYQNLDLVSNGNTHVIDRTRNSFLNDSRQLFVKYSYLLRI